MGLEFIKIYLRIFHIHVNHFDLDTFCEIFVTSRLLTKLHDLHYNQCFEDHADHVFIGPVGLQILLYTGNKISFVETGKKKKKTLSASIWCARNCFILLVTANNVM